jgi:hypothetical protein
LSALLATRGSRVAPLPPPVQSHNQLRGGMALCLRWAVTVHSRLTKKRNERGGLSKPPRFTAFAAPPDGEICSEPPWWRGSPRARRERKMEEHRDPVAV